MNTDRSPRDVMTAVVVFALLAGVVHAAEPTLLAEQGGGRLPIEGEGALRLRDIRGTISLRSGLDGELRFLATEGSPKGEERPVAVWSDGNTLILEPAAGNEEVEYFLEIAMSRDLDIEVELYDASLTVNGLAGGVSGAVEHVELIVRGAQGDVDLEASSSVVELQSVGGGVAVSGDGNDVRVGKAAGDVDLTLEGGTLVVREVGARIAGDLDGVGARIESVAEPFELTASDGSLELSAIEGGATLRLTGTTLSMDACKGDFMIETDADVAFRGMEASIHVNGYGGNVTGQGNIGLVEAKTSGGTIRLSEINGPVGVEGDRLDVSVEQVSGEIRMFVSSSTVTVVGAAAEVSIESEFGDVEVRGAKAAVTILSENGDVRASELTGPLTVEADGSLVDVAWNSMTFDTECRVENRSGDVTVVLPRHGGGRIEASAGFGRVDSDVEGIEISEDGDRASGILNRRPRPSVRIEAGGGVRLTGGR